LRKILIIWKPAGEGPKNRKFSAYELYQSGRYPETGTPGDPGDVQNEGMLNHVRNAGLSAKTPSSKTNSPGIELA
jgi:hypothetical protein